MMRKTFAVAFAAVALHASYVAAQTPVAAARSQPDRVPDLRSLVTQKESELASVVERFTTDLTALRRRYDATASPDQRRRLREFYDEWRSELRAVGFDELTHEGKVDYVLLANYLNHQIALLARQERHRSETVALIPFADRLLSLQDARRNLAPVDARAASLTLAAVARQVDSLRVRVESAARADSAVVTTQGVRSPVGGRASRTVANRAARNLDQIRKVMESWYEYYHGYDPIFTWWVKEPYDDLDEALTRYARALRERVVGFKPATTGGSPREGAGSTGANEGPIVGDPIGAQGLAEDLEYEMIPYTPRDLIAIAEREYAFSLSEMKKAAREMGFGDDWKAAVEKVKNSYVEPGKQPELIRDLAREAEAFFDRHDWVTIPALAREDWRMEMMSPERQRIAPFFLGGESIIVSYPTVDMSAEEKMMSLRGNNPHFSRAVVFHELNPGHHLQHFMMARYNPHRRLFATPFWSEGQALYWEMFLWDHGFHVRPEDRVGALFWRMHRSARIMFSLRFHLGELTPEQAVQFLVDTVAFERANAEGEVRRSFSGDYSPLYQIAYMIGGLQLRALHAELVGSGRMAERAFHDAVLQGGPMPIAMVRARLADLPLTRDGPRPWRFAETLPPPVPAGAGWK